MGGGGSGATGGSSLSIRTLALFQILFGTLVIFVALNPDSRWGPFPNLNNPILSRFQRRALIAVGVAIVGFGTFTLLSR